MHRLHRRRRQQRLPSAARRGKTTMDAKRPAYLATRTELGAMIPANKQSLSNLPRRYRCRIPAANRITIRRTHSPRVFTLHLPLTHGSPPQRPYVASRGARAPRNRLRPGSSSRRTDARIHEIVARSSPLPTVTTEIKDPSLLACVVAADISINPFRHIFLLPLKILDNVEDGYHMANLMSYYAPMISAAPDSDWPEMSHVYTYVPLLAH